MVVLSALGETVAKEKILSMIAQNSPASLCTSTGKAAFLQLYEV